MLWKTFNNALGKGPSNVSTFIEVDGSFITKPFDIAQYFYGFFTCKVNKLRTDMCFDDVQCAPYILDSIMKDKICRFELSPIEAVNVEKLLLAIKNDKPSGLDGLDGKLLKIAAHQVASPVAHICNQSLKWGICPQV